MIYIIVVQYQFPFCKHPIRYNAFNVDSRHNANTFIYTVFISKGTVTCDTEAQMFMNIKVQYVSTNNCMVTMGED